MTTRWNDLVALAREIEQTRREGKPMDPQKARRLARAVLTLQVDDEVSRLPNRAAGPRPLP